MNNISAKISIPATKNPAKRVIDHALWFFFTALPQNDLVKTIRLTKFSQQHQMDSFSDVSIYSIYKTILLRDFGDILIKLYILRYFSNGPLYSPPLSNRMHFHFMQFALQLLNRTPWTHQQLDFSKEKSYFPRMFKPATYWSSIFQHVANNPCLQAMQKA